MSALTEIIIQINHYISRCDSEESYQGTHDEQMSLHEINENYQKLKPSEQKDVQDHFSMIYNRTITPAQSHFLDQSNASLAKAAFISAMGGVVGGIVFQAGFCKSILAAGFCGFGGTFFANRDLNKAHPELAALKKKKLPLERIQAIFYNSNLSSDVMLSPINLDEVRDRRRSPGR